MKRNCKGLKKNWHWVFFVLVALLTIYMDVYVAQHFLDGDTSEDLYHGWIIAQQRNPFTRDVYLSTELRLLDIASIYSIFFLFIQDWTLVRILGTITMQALYVLSFLYVCRQAKIGFAAALIAAGLMILPFSTAYARIVLYHLFYILYFTNAFWILGLTLKLMQMPIKERKKALVPALLLAVLWFFVGLNGVRHMLILGLPLLVFAFVEFVRTLNQYHWQNRRLIGSAKLMDAESIRLVGILFGSCLCFAVGYVINNAVLLDYYGVQNMGDILTSINIAPERLAKILKGWLIAIGARNSELKFIGFRGISLAASLFGFGYLLMVSWRAMREQTKTTAEKMTYGLFSVSTIVTVVIFLFEWGDREYELYFIPVLFLIFPVVAQEIQKMQDEGTPLGKRVLTLCVCACLVFQGAYTVFYLRVEKDKWDSWNGLSLTNLNLVDESRDCVSFMQENGYSHGMIDYWYANVMMEMTDGELIMAPLQCDYDASKLKIYHWGTSKTAFLPENLPEKIILFVSHQKGERFQKAFPEAKFVFDGYVFGGYEISAESITQ